jgi:hypothetical protein
VQNFPKKKCLDFFESRLKRKLGEVLGVKLKQTLFFHLILKKILRKNQKNSKISNFFLFLFWLFCAFKTLTIDLVHFYDIITAENVGTGIPLNVKFRLLNSFN